MLPSQAVVACIQPFSCACSFDVAYSLASDVKNKRGLYNSDCWKGKWIQLIGRDIDAGWGLEGMDQDGDLKDPDVVAGWGLEGMDPDVGAGWGLEGMDTEGDLKGTTRKVEDNSNEVAESGLDVTGSGSDVTGR